MHERESAEPRHGPLFPSRLPEFHRLPPPAESAHAVAWFWVPEWSIPAGEESRQEVLAFPACNLVVEGREATLVGPPTRRSERVLRGRGWAVGALLRPASVPGFLDDPAAARDAAFPVAAAELVETVCHAMRHPRPDGEHRTEAAQAMSQWIAARIPVPPPGSAAETANRLPEIVAGPEVRRVDQLAKRLHVSVRTLQRLSDRFFGITPLAMIRRRRLQEAAARLRAEPRTSIAEVASDLGYGDQAHFATDFRAALGVTPRAYRLKAAATGDEPPPQGA